MSSENSSCNDEPGAPLSNIDLAKFLMNDSLTKVQELRQNVKEDFAIDRQHNKKIIEAVVTGLCQRLDGLEDLVKRKAESKEAVEDLDLKVTTISTYNEGLLHNLLQNRYTISLMSFNTIHSHARSSSVYSVITPSNLNLT